MSDDGVTDGFIWAACCRFLLVFTSQLNGILEKIQPRDGCCVSCCAVSAVGCSVGNIFDGNFAYADCFINVVICYLKKI